MRVKYVLLISIGLLWNPILTLAQVINENRVIPPAPIAAALSKYGEIPVGHYSGTPNISIPIYNIQSGNLALPITLSYHLSSIKLNEIPGWVGLGWSLNAGGVITRTVKGLPDDLNFGGYQGLFYDLTKFNEETNDLILSVEYADAIMNRLRDGEADLFSFNFNGHSGTFFLGTDGQIHIASKEMMQVSYHPVDTEPFGWWEVITADGVHYSFEHTERTNYEIGNPPSEISYNSSWYLSRISDPAKGEISFNYTTPARTRYYSRSFSRFGFDAVGYSGSAQRTFSSHDGIFLDHITFSNGKLFFETTNRDDNSHPGTSVPAMDKKLSAITLKDIDDNVIKRWDLQFTGPSERLKLLSIQEKGGTEVFPPYLFFYNPTKMPFSPSYDMGGEDHWGYYNGTEGQRSAIPMTYFESETGEFTLYPGAIREPVDEYTKAEVLERIAYPTGGYTEFEYEPNQYNTVLSGIKPKYRIIPKGYSYRFELQCSAYDLDNCYYPGFDFNTGTTVSFDYPTILKLTISCEDCDATRGGSYKNKEKSWQQMVPSGTYSVNNLFLDPIGTIVITPDWWIDTRIVKFSMTAYSLVPMPPTGGGLRVKSTKDFDGVAAHTPVIKRYEYTDGILKYYPSYKASMSDISNYLGSGQVESSEPIQQIPLGALIEYPTVKEINADGGYTLYEFTTNREYGDGVGLSVAVEDWALNSTHFPVGADGSILPLIDNSNMRGMLTRKAHFQSNSQIIKELILQYDETAYDYFNTLSTSNFRFNNFIGMPSGNLSITTFALSRMKSSWVRKRKEIQRDYIYHNSDVTVASLESDFYYDNPMHLQVSRIEQRLNGKVRTTEFFYPLDYSESNSDESVTGLKNAFMHSAVV